MPTDLELDQAFERGRMAERMEGYESSQASLAKKLDAQGRDIAEIKQTLAEVKGAWRVSLKFGAVAAAVATLIGSYFGAHR